jgi:hypothetical protein
VPNCSLSVTDTCAPLRCMGAFPLMACRFSAFSFSSPATAPVDRANSCWTLGLSFYKLSKNDGVHDCSCCEGRRM